MPATIYALLVGINEYLGGVSRLNGCVNDVKRMVEFLRGRTEGGEYTLAPLLLTSGDPDNPQEQKPTRQAIIDAFQTHLAKAGKGDIALFYYSGHGSQENAPQEFWPIEPDRLDETLVCYDSRDEGQWDLADKELAVLIEAIARKEPHILVILDSCHSGSGTRGEEGTSIRLAKKDNRNRSLNDFLPEVKDAVKDAVKDVVVKQVVNQGAEEQDEKTGKWFTLPHGRHVVIAACQAEESAREKLMPNGELHGVLSYYLLETLQQVGPTLSYRDVFSRTNTLVRNLISDQKPLLAATQSDDLKEPFLGGAIVEQLPYYNLAYEKRENEWFIAAGAIHGLRQPVGDETTHLAVFPLGQNIALGDDIEDAIGTVRIVEVRAGKSRVKWDGGDPVPETDQTFKAVVTATPLPLVAVHLSGDDAPALERLQKELKDSLIARLVEDPAEALLRVVADLHDDAYRLKRAGDLQPLHVLVSNKAVPSAARMAKAKVEHMAQWMQLLNLENTQSKLPAGAVRMELYRYDPETGQSELLDDQASIRLRYDPQKNQVGVPIQIRLIHTKEYNAQLYCMLVDMTEDFGVTVDQAFFGGGVWLEPGHDVWVSTSHGEPYIYVYVPDELVAQGVTKIRDILKLIISTDESDAILLKQDGLEVVADATTRGQEISRKVVPPSSLERLMRRVQTRAIGARIDKGKLSDWRTTQVMLTTVCQSGGVSIESDKDVELAEGVKLKSHPGLKARAELVQFDEGKRDVGNLALPAVFRYNTNLAEPFAFRPSRGGDAGASVIVLNELENVEAITPEQPLVIQTETRLKENEAVLPLAFDNQSGLYLPLGVGVQADNVVQILLDRLPASDSRDIQGSVKLFFQKVIIEKLGAEKFGLDSPTARLAAATVEDGQVIYDNSPITLKEKVKDAQRILLYVHGILGDTRGMVQSAYGLQGVTTNSMPRLAGQYDLVLAFDYENINTPIEETAINLKKALAEVGLTPGHDKVLHVVAHSLGCLVTRQYIEREAGNKVVKKVILVAPPNAGSPWATIQDYATIGLGAALNGIAAALWPPSAIPALVGALSSITTATLTGIESVDVTLDQMKPGSSFYKVLNESDDPGVPYVIIAGNTSKIKYAQSQADALAAEQGVLKRLLERLGSPQTRHQLLSLAFFNAPNDMAVSVKSMLSLPSNRQMEIPPLEVACDHNSYFNTEGALRNIVEALQKE